jgi:hypothetical protein
MKERAMGGSSKEAQARAEAKFQKQKAVAEGAQATAEHEAQALAVDVKTSQLRSLRLAKEAADKNARAKNGGKARAKTKSAPANKKHSP